MPSTGSAQTVHQAFMYCWEGEHGHAGSFTWQNGQWRRGYGIADAMTCTHQPPPTTCECWECLHAQCQRGRRYECDECQNERYERERQAARELIQGYGYRPEPYTMFGDGRTHLGVELELEDGGAMYEAAAAACDIMGERGFLKEDGSISGFEIVTQPHTHAEHHEGFRWADLLAAMTEHDMYASDEAGIHIHVSRLGFDGPAHAFRWQKFVYANRPLWDDIARRTNSSWARWPSMDRSPTRVPIYDSWGDVSGYSETLTNPLLNQQKGVAMGMRQKPSKWMGGRDFRQPDYYGEFRNAGYSPQRYSVINPLNTHTLELRLFRSTTDAEELYSCIDLVDSSVQYTRDLTVADIRAGAFTTSAYRSYLTGNDAYSALASRV